MREAALLRAYLVLKHPDMALHAFRGRAAIMRRLAEHHLRDAQAKWRPEYRSLKPLSMFRKALILSRNRYLKNKYLYHMVRYLDPDVVVETGVHYGISTVFMLQALEDNGHGTLISIDLPEKDYKSDICCITQRLPRGCTTGFLVPQRLKHRWRLLLGDAKELLEPVCRENAPLDLFHHDSEHTYSHMMFEFKTAWPHLRRGGLLMLDDWDWNEAPLEFGVEKALKGEGTFNMYLNRGCIVKR